MKKNNNSLLIFDCDGVLVDSEPLANRIFIQCLQNEGFEVDEAYAAKHFHGISTRDCIAHVEALFKRKVSGRFAETYAHLTHEEIRNTLKPVPHIEEALAVLSFQKCVASGSEPDKIALSLEVTGLKKYFTHIYSSLQVPRGKPYPDIFLFAARELKFAPEQCIVIEDSTPGVQAALQAGMTVLWYKPIPENEAAIPEKVTAFADMADLPAILSGILKNAHPQ